MICLDYRLIPCIYYIVYIYIDIYLRKAERFLNIYIYVFNYLCIYTDIYIHSLNQYESLLTHCWFCLLFVCDYWLLVAQKGIPSILQLTNACFLWGFCCWGISHPSKNQRCEMAFASGGRSVP